MEPFARHAVVPGVRTIAVLRANGLGDLVFSLPALDALRLAYPHAEIVLLATEWHRDLLANRVSPVDRVVPVPFARGVRERNGRSEDAAVLEAFFSAMQAERFDLALQMHGGGRWSNPFVQRLGARVTAGSRAADAVPLDRWVRYVFHQHEVLRHLEIVGLVGAVPVVLQPRLSLTESDLAEADAVVDAQFVVALHPSATDPRRLWPAKRFALVGDAMAAAGATVVVIGSHAERALVDTVVSGMERDALPLAGSLSLGGLAGLLARCAVVIGNDSGPLHLAAAVGASTVGIFWASSALNAPPLGRARHRPLVSFRLHCPVCGLDQTRVLCGHAVSYVEDIGVDEVVAAAEDLLGLDATSPAALARALDWRPGAGLKTVEWEP